LYKEYLYFCYYTYTLYPLSNQIVLRFFILLLTFQNMYQESDRFKN